MTTKKLGPQHIIELRASNVKRIQAVQIKPTKKGLVLIGGKNGEGKSSTIDSIEIALGGKRAMPPEPVRRGTRKAEILIKLTDLVVERVISSSGTALVVRNAEGEKQGSPQELLDSLCARISFDPLEFVTMKPEKQDALLKQIIGLDFKDLEAKRKALYDERTERGRELKKVEAQLASLPAPEAGLPAEEISMSELLAQLGELQAIRSSNEKHRDELDAMQRDVRIATEAVKEQQRLVRVAEEALKAARSKCEDAEDYLAEAQKKQESKADMVATLEEPDFTEAEEKARTLDQTNAKIRAAQQHRKLSEEAGLLDAAVCKLSASIADLDDEKQKRIAEAKFPIDGLGFDESGVLLDGLPLEQASDAQKLRLSVAIGAALNPTVRVMLVRNGSLLDNEHLALLAQLADENDLQVWVERVSEDGAGCAVIIEDGLARVVEEGQAAQ